MFKLSESRVEGSASFSDKFTSQSYESFQKKLLNHHIFLYHKIIEEHWAQAQNARRDICIAPSEAALFWEEQAQLTILAENFLQSDLGQTWLEQKSQLEEQVKNYNSSHQASPLLLLKKCFALSYEEELVFSAVYWAEKENRYQKMYSYLQNDFRVRLPMILWLKELFSLGQTAIKSEFFSSRGTLLREGLLERVSDSHDANSNDQLKISLRVLEFLNLEGELSPPFISYTYWLPPQAPRFLAQKSFSEKIALVQEKLAQVLSPTLVVLHNTCLATQLGFVQGVIEKNCKGVLSINLGELRQDSRKEELFSQIVREARLENFSLFFHNFQKIEGKDEWREILCRLSHFSNPVFLAPNKNENTYWPQHYFPYYIVSLPSLNYSQRQELWKQYQEESKWNEFPNLAHHSSATPGQVDIALQVGENFQALDKKKDKPHWHHICQGQFQNQLGQLAQKIEAPWTWDDLVLEREVKVQLEEICQRIQYHDKVFREWGFTKKVPTQAGVLALFTGGAGTGKTMATAVMANKLLLDLYRIDLSQVISKYIGETEHNLEKIFQEAEKSHVLLFFDEADALFGKRSKVQSSHDRYANMEVSYLLQRIENYPGLVILASNFSENVDEAFLRRLHYKIDFPFPDQTARKEIWKRAFGERTPLSSDVDFDYLAQRFSLSGGHIKNIVLSSAFFAASEQRPVSLDHIIKAALREYDKIDKVFPED